MKNTVIIGCAIFLCLRCGYHGGENTAHSSKVINFQELERVKDTHIEDAFFDKPYFIKLKSDSRVVFGKIDQIKLSNNNIYILDEGIKSLLVYDINGNALGKVGKFGQGPNEYLDISCFDVDSIGNIYTVDGRLDKLFVYDNKFQFVKSVKLPFEVDIMQMLDNGNYMFGLSSWNNGKCKGDRVVITDKDLNVIKSYLKYDEYIDHNYWISGYQFVELQNSIVYNRPIDNHIYIFSKGDGELESDVLLDFGDENVSNEIKKDIERNLREFDGCILLKEFAVVTDKFVLGTLWYHRESRAFIIDNQFHKIYLGAKNEDFDKSALTGFSDSALISYINPDFYQEYQDYAELSDDIIAHLKDGEFVLCVRKMKFI